MTARGPTASVRAQGYQHVEAQAHPSEQGRGVPLGPFLGLASDERLTEEMRHGNEAAFEVIYGRYSRGMLAMCRHILGSRDEAEDVLQQAFASAWADVQRLQPPAPVALKPWLYAVARHRCISVLRTRPPSTVELQDVACGLGLADEVGLRDDLRTLLADVRELPEEQRTALVLSELGGLSHTDIAGVLGRKPSGVKSLVFQARTTLGNWRDARESACAEMREQLCVLRGSELRRGPVRHHLQRCPDCRAFSSRSRRSAGACRSSCPCCPRSG